MSKHTPGPWTAVDDPQDGSAENWYIITDEEDVLSLGLSEPDARLIAAAPDLLAALQAIYGKAMPKAGHASGKATHYLVPKALVDAARAAIAKAEGVS